MGELQIEAINSNFENFESALYMKSVSMPLSRLPICMICGAHLLLNRLTNTFSPVLVKESGLCYRCARCLMRGQSEEVAPASGCICLCSLLSRVLTWKCTCRLGFCCLCPSVHIIMNYIVRLMIQKFCEECHLFSIQFLGQHALQCNL